MVEDEGSVDPAGDNEIAAVTKQINHQKSLSGRENRIMHTT